jgi:formiminotetrahydrofolate cyclodeaminase
MTDPWLAPMTVEAFVDRLSSADPTPGGGAAAAMIGATAAALVSMVAELSTSPKLDQFRPTIDRSRGTAREAGTEFLRLADEDAEGFEAFMTAWRSTKGMEPADKRAVLSDAGRVSLQPPLAILRLCVTVAQAGEELAGRSNVNLVSDLLCASRAVEAAAHCAVENVLVNLANLTDRAEADELRAETKRLVTEVERLARATRRTASTGTLREPRRRTKDLA